MRIIYGCALYTGKYSTKNVKVCYFQKCQKEVNLSVKCVCTKEPKTQYSSSIQLKEWVYSLEMFTMDLVFSWDSGLIILCKLHDGECVNSWNDNYQITISGSLLLFTIVIIPLMDFSMEIIKFPFTFPIMCFCKIFASRYISTISIYQIS